MTLDIARQRLHNQQFAAGRQRGPGELVRWFGAVQAQDYLGALWALGLRSAGLDERAVERAVAERAIVRTWPMRGTLHFVAAEDARWMLGLLTPRVLARSAGRYRQLGLDSDAFARSAALTTSALRGGNRLTREALYGALAAGGVSTDDGRGLHILGYLAQTGLICFGPREGRQHTLVLLDEWLPPTAPLAREAALAELARRYVTSHGPALLEDFVWWSGLTVGEARAALELAGPHLSRQVVDGRSYWLPAATAADEAAPEAAHLLPAFDEYTVAYRDRSAVLGPAHAARSPGEVLNPAAIVGGQAVGTWRRAHTRARVRVTLTPFAPLDDGARAALEAAAMRYGAFLGLPAELRVA